LLLIFELLKHLHKRGAKLGKGKKFAKRTRRPLSEDQNISKKMVFDNFEQEIFSLTCPAIS
jgi:hypothetical protein